MNDAAHLHARFLESLLAAARGGAPWKPALENLLRLGRGTGEADADLLADALRHTALALAHHHDVASGRGPQPSHTDGLR